MLFPWLPVLRFPLSNGASSSSLHHLDRSFPFIKFLDGDTRCPYKNSTSHYVLRHDI